MSRRLALLTAAALAPTAACTDEPAAPLPPDILQEAIDVPVILNAVRASAE